MKRACSVLLALAALVPVEAIAQDAAPDEAEATAARVADAAGDDDITLTVNAGANLAYGNARSLAANLAAAFRLRRGMHGFSAELGWTYGRAASRIDPAGTPPNNEFGDFDENANNFIGQLRYDAFFDPDNAVFVTARVRVDPFARLEPRLQGQVGYMRNILREESHRFWMEAGIDFTYDRFSEPLEVGGGVLSQDRGVGSLRVFVGYDNQINDVLTYRTGFEFLWGPLRTVGSGQEAAMRFEWVNQFTSKIEDWLQLSLDVTGRLDSAPPGQAEAWNEQANQPTQMFDLLTTLNLVGAFDLDGEPAAEEEAEEPAPACPETECPVCPECAAEAPPPEPELAPEAQPEPDAADETSGEGEADAPAAAEDSAEADQDAPAADAAQE